MKAARLRALLALAALLGILQGCTGIPDAVRAPLIDRLTHQAEVQANQSDYGAAASALTLALTLEPDRAELYIQRGQMYLLLYEWDQSLEDYNTAIALAPDDADAYFQRGVLYYSILQTGQELREEALADFKHYLELAPDGQYTAQAREYAARIEAELAALAE